jgi:thymidine kinase
MEVICGSMFSGKTEELIRRLRRAEMAGQMWRFSNQKSTHVILRKMSFPITRPKSEVQL